MFNTKPNKTMNKSTIATLFAVMLLFGCYKEPIDPEENLTITLNGWDISKSNYDFDINPRDLFFVNESVGFVVGYNGDIYKTIDSGTTWRKLNSGTTLHLHSVYFVDEMVGFVSGVAMSGCLDTDCDKGCVLLKTTNGGETWTKTFFPDYIRILSMKFFDTAKGIALIHKPDIPNSRDEYIATTSDGGENWTMIDLPIKPAYDKLFFVDNLVFVAGENQRIYKSSDYGHSWKTIITPIEAYHQVRNLYFYNENIGYIDGITSIYKTLDGGLSWNKTNFPFTNFDAFHFSTENEGFNIVTVTAYEGGEFPSFKGSICYKTNDGGNTWQKSELMESLYLGLTFFPQRSLGYSFNFSEFYIIKKME